MTIFELNIFGLNIAPTYYGLMYAISFIVGYYIIKKRAYITGNQLDTLFYFLFFGVILGGRFGYILFYNLDYFLSSPLSIFKVWEGGMSFHGGVIGVIIAMILFSKFNNFSFKKVADQVTLVLPIGLGLGRIGNYINGELLGYSGYNGLLAVYKNGIGYFPSPLLEALLEGLILYFILLFFYKRKHSPGQIASLFLFFYGVFRIGVELFFRQPDSHIGLLFGIISTGTLLSIPMVVIGGILYFYFKKKTSL